MLLLDEPFGALDAKVRKELRRWLRRLHEEMHVTSVFVTHDQEEALEVADRVVVMNEGRIEQIGTPEEVYDSPATPFVYGFLGNVNLFHGRVHQGRVSIGESELDAPEWTEARDQAGIAYVRTYDVQLHAAPTAAGSLAGGRAPCPRLRAGRSGWSSIWWRMAGRSRRTCPRGQFDRAPVTKGQRMYVSPTHVRVFPKEAERRTVPATPASARGARGRRGPAEAQRRESAPTAWEPAPGRRTDEQDRRSAACARRTDARR